MPRGRPPVFQPARILAWLALLAGLAGAIAVYRIYLGEARRDVRDRYEAELQPYGRTLESAIARRLALIEGLRAFVEAEQQSRNLRAGFRVFAFGLMASAEGLRSLQLIQDGVIRIAFPDVDGASLEGYNLREHPESDLNRLVEEAITSDSLRLLGPFHRQVGSFRMTAIRAYSAPNGNPIGAVAAVLELPPILDEAGMDRTAGLRVALRDQRDTLLAGDPTVAGQMPVTFAVQVLPGTSWTLSAIPAQGWDAALPRHTGVVGLVAFLFALLIAALAWLVADRQQALAAAVEQRTRSLRGANQELQRQIAVRQQVEAQLLQSQKMEGMGRLAGGIAHDFNNLLTAIIGYTTLIRGSLKPGDPIAEDVGEVEKASRRAADLTRQLLAFARKQVVKPRAVQVSELVSELHRMLERLVGPETTLVTEVAAGLQPVRVDPGQLEQAVTNLVVNARDAMPEGGTVTVRARGLTLAENQPNPWGMPAGEYVQLEVEDQGTGMDEATMSRIFEPFFTTKDHGKGTGLGLATTYGIIRQAGGTITVESAPGRGSTFKVLLPCTSELPEPATDPAAGRPGTAGVETVLVVDDEAVVIDVAERALSQRGYRVYTAIDSTEAAAQFPLLPAPVAALITDLQMPGLTGEALAEQLRLTHPDLRILYMSGRAEPEGGLPPGTAFISKPFTPDELVEALRDLLDAEVPA